MFIIYLTEQRGSDIANYNWNTPGYVSAADHFTQLVWKSSTKIGCARCVGAKGKGFYKTYVVCDFEGPGNIKTAAQFKANVLPEK